MDGCVNGRGELVDWRALGIRFRQLGYGTSDVARALNLPVSTVNSWFNYGIEPRYSNGALLVGMYRGLEAKLGTRANRICEIS